MFDLEIPIAGETIRIAVRLNALGGIGAMLKTVVPDVSQAKVVVITDENVGPCHAATVLRSLTNSGVSVREYRIAAGEASKSLETLGAVYEFLASCRLGRDGIILALGGGVVSDLAGFAAATWMRGVALIVCPTSVEAAVDASIGGKNAVNVPGGKNLAGTFHQPFLVVIDPICLKSLETRDVRAGLAESIKHALIASNGFLIWHEDHIDSILTLDDTITPDLLLRNVVIKTEIVRRDPYERTGERLALNFGHTIGHAIESSCGFSLRHGECVALGMVAACRLSQSLGMLPAPQVDRVVALLQRAGLPTTLDPLIDPQRILDAIGQDKKGRGGHARFVLLDGIGRPVVRDDVGEDRVRRAYETLGP